MTAPTKALADGLAEAYAKGFADCREMAANHAEDFTCPNCDTDTAGDLASEIRAMRPTTATCATCNGIGHTTSISDHRRCPDCAPTEAERLKAFEDAAKPDAAALSKVYRAPTVAVPAVPIDDAAEARIEALLAKSRAPTVATGEACPTCQGTERNPADPEESCRCCAPWIRKAAP